MAPKKRKAAPDAPEPPAPPRKRSRKATKSKEEEDNKPAKEEDEPIERIDGVRSFTEAKVRSLADEHAKTAVLRLRDRSSITVLPGELAFTLREIDDSGEAIFLETKIECDWKYTYKNDRNTPPSGKQAWHGHVRQLMYQVMNPPVQLVYACMVGYVLDNLAACRANVPFLRMHKRDATIRILSVAISKEVSKKPKTRRLPSGEDGAQKNFIVIAQISATKFVVHPGVTCARKKLQYPTAALTMIDTANGGSGGKKGRQAAKSEEPQRELLLPDDVGEINSKSGAHRTFRCNIATASFQYRSGM